MKYTPNYNFKKPDQTDSYNVDDFNGNMDILDTKLKDIESSVEVVDTKVKITDAQSHFTGETLDKVLDEIYEKSEENTTAIQDGKAVTTISTLEASLWSDNTYSLESTYPNSQYDIEIGVSSTATKEQFMAFGMAGIPSDASKNVLTALGVVPTIDIPIVIKAWKKGA